MRPIVAGGTTAGTAAWEGCVEWVGEPNDPLDGVNGMFVDTRGMPECGTAGSTFAGRTPPLPESECECVCRVAIGRFSVHPAAEAGAAALTAAVYVAADICTGREAAGGIEEAGVRVGNSAAECDSCGLKSMVEGNGTV